MKRIALALALGFGLVGTPAEASQYPTEGAVGPTLGVAGPGIAARQFVLPWLGFQVGANMVGNFALTGGTVMYSYYHDDRGQRIYLTAGVATTVTRDLFEYELYPAVGLGGSQILNDRWTFFGDLSFALARGWPSSSRWILPAPQIGFLYTF